MAKSNVIVIDRDLVSPKALLSLKRTAIKVYLIFLTKRQMGRVKRPKGPKYEIANNGEIVFTYLEAEQKYGFSKKQFSKALDDLVEKGFLDIEHLGGACQRDKSMYAISERWRKYGTDEFEKRERPKESVKRGYAKPSRK